MGRFHSYAPESSESIITHHPGLLTMDFSPHVEDFTIKQVSFINIHTSDAFRTPN